MRLTYRWPPWAGSKEPPSKPMRNPSLSGPGGLIQCEGSRNQCSRLNLKAAPSWTCLPVAAHHIFEGGELFGPDRAAGMHLAGADADFRTHAELAAIGELGGGVPQHDGAVDAVHEGLGGAGVLCHDGVGMVRAIVFDMADGLFQPLHHAHRDDGVEI